MSVRHNGDYSTFSPELLGMHHASYGDFVFGNVWKTTAHAAMKTINFRTTWADIVDKVAQHSTQRASITSDDMKAPSSKVMLLSGHVKMAPNGTTYRIEADSIRREGDESFYQGHVEIHLDDSSETGSIVKSSAARQTKDLTLLMDEAEVTLPNANPNKEQDKDGDVYLHFEQPTDLRLVIATVAEFTGKDVILAHDVHGTITVAGSGPFTKLEAFAVFVQSLNAAGLDAIQSDQTIKIIAMKK